MPAGCRQSCKRWWWGGSTGELSLPQLDPCHPIPASSFSLPPPFHSRGGHSPAPTGIEGYDIPSCTLGPGLGRAMQLRMGTLRACHRGCAPWVTGLGRGRIKQGEPLMFSWVPACMPSRFSRVQLFATPWTLAHQAPLSMGLSRQEYWGAMPFSRGIFQTQGSNPGLLHFLHWQARTSPLAPPVPECFAGWERRI